MMNGLMKLIEEVHMPLQHLQLILILVENNVLAVAVVVIAAGNVVAALAEHHCWRVWRKDTGHCRKVHPKDL